MRFSRVRTVVFGILLSSALVYPVVAEAEPDAAFLAAVMQPGAGEKGGELAKGELLATALKREKLDTNSVRLAMKSIGELFDFRLSRAGDRYVYRVGNKKLQMLRYQRKQHVYEAVLNEETGEYEAHLVDVEKEAEKRALGPSGLPDEEEIDVEQAVVAEQLKQAPAEDIPEQNARQELDNMDVAKPEDPVLPEDPALAGVPSPDEEFPTQNETGAEGAGADSETNRDGAEPEEAVAQGLAENGANPDEEMDEGQEGDSAQADDDLLNQPVYVPPSARNQEKTEPEQPNRIVPDQKNYNTPFNCPSPKSRKNVELEAGTFSSISVAVLLIGLFLFIFSLIAIIVPGIRARKRCSAQGFHVRNMLQISSHQRIACIEEGNQAFYIAIDRNSMSFLAPCPVDDEAFWKYLRQKTYWNQMAHKALSDRQLAALVQEFGKVQDKSETTCKTKNIASLGSCEDLSEDEEEDDVSGVVAENDEDLDEAEGLESEGFEENDGEDEDEEDDGGKA